MLHSLNTKLLELCYNCRFNSILSGVLGSVSVEGTTVGGSRSYDIVELVDASVGGMPLPTLHATVLDFPQVSSHTVYSPEDEIIAHKWS